MPRDIEKNFPEEENGLLTFFKEIGQNKLIKVGDSFFQVEDFGWEKKDPLSLLKILTPNDTWRPTEVNNIVKKINLVIDDEGNFVQKLIINKFLEKQLPWSDAIPINVRNAILEKRAFPEYFGSKHQYSFGYIRAMVESVFPDLTPKVWRVKGQATQEDLQQALLRYQSLVTESTVITSGLESNSAMLIDKKERYQKGAEAVTIDVLPAMHDGAGDLMNAIRLAYRLKQNGRFKTIRLLFESSEDLDRLRALLSNYPSDASDKVSFEKDGIVFINGEKVDRDLIIRSSKLTLVSQLKVDKGNIDQRGSPVNIYLQEESIKDYFATQVRVITEKGVSIKTASQYIDRNGQVHHIISTGIGSEMGTLFGGANTQAGVIEDKRRILEILMEQNKLQVLPPGIDNDRWGSAYYRHDFVEKYESPLEQAIEDGKMQGKGIVIFDFTNSIKNSRSSSDFTHIYYSVDGKMEIVKGKKYPDVKILHIGKCSNIVYKSITKASELPVMVSAEVSWGEAVEFDKVIATGFPAYKSNMVSDLVSFAGKYLDGMDLIRILDLKLATGSMFSLHGIAPAIIEFYYLNIDQIIRLFDDLSFQNKVELDLDDISLAESRIKTLSKGNNIDDEQIKFLFRVYKESKITPFYRQYMRNSSNSASILMERRIAGLILYDKDYQSSLHKLNKLLIEHADLIPNLIKLIDQSVAEYDRTALLSSLTYEEAEAVLREMESKSNDKKPGSFWSIVGDMLSQKRQLAIELILELHQQGMLRNSKILGWDLYRQDLLQDTDTSRKLFEEVCLSRLEHQVYSKRPHPNIQAKSADDAMKADVSKTGGIDLTSVNRYLESKNNGDGIKFHMDPAMLAQLQNAPGFVPVIINIQPLKSIAIFLGLNQEPADKFKQEALAKA